MERTAGYHAVHHHAGLAEGDAALHTACALLSLLCLRQRSVELIEVFDALQWCSRLAVYSVIFQKSCWLSHLLSSLLSLICVECLNLRLLTAQALLLHLHDGVHHAAVVMRHNLLEFRQVLAKVSQDLFSS